MSDADLKRPTKNGPTREQLEGPIDDKLYHDCVRQAKELLKEQETINWKLGELASKIDKKYGEGRLKEFAEEIDLSHSFLRDCRATFRAWSEKTGRPAFWTAKALNAHPKRLDIIKDKPQITQAEARAKMQKYRDHERDSKANGSHKPAPPEEPEAEMPLDEQWQNDLVQLCDEIISRPAYWDETFPEWKSYACPSHIETLVNEGMTVFASIVSTGSARVFRLHEKD